MRIRNKAHTWYRDGKLTFAPGEEKEMSDHDARELMNKLPWHFEKVAEPARAKPAPPPPPAQETTEEPRRSGRGYRSRE